MRSIWVTAAALIVAALVAGPAGAGEKKSEKASRKSTDKPAQKGTSMPDKVVKRNEEWRKILTAEQYRITREKGTERAFTGEYHDFKGKGTYVCVCCGNELFSSKEKYDSGSGWPSFWMPVSNDHVDTKKDMSYGMIRVEVLCRRCDAHLGHVFEDGPKPTGLRYCINSASLRFVAAEKKQEKRVEKK